MPAGSLGALDPALITKLFHRGYNIGGRVPANLPGPSTSAHIVVKGHVNPGGNSITVDKAVQVHGDIRSPKGDLASILAHAGVDTIWAGLGTTLGHGCAVKFD